MKIEIGDKVLVKTTGQILTIRDILEHPLYRLYPTDMAYYVLENPRWYNESDLQLTITEIRNKKLKELGI